MGTMARGSRGAVLVGSLVLVATVSACGRTTEPPDGASEQPTPTVSVSPNLRLGGDPVVLLRFAGSLDGRVFPQQVGSADVDVSVASLDGGRLTEAAALDSAVGTAVRFPSYSGGSPYPRAVLRVEPRAGAELNPGSRDMEWGADVRMDRVSGGITVDNGDNLVQRGLSSDTALFKAEVDKDFAACTVRGTRGTLVVRSREALKPTQWYRIRCSREAERLRVVVTELLADGSERNFARTKQGKIGSVNFDDPTIPVAIGGKLAHDGSVVGSATDQLNGDLVRPVIAFG